jgi:hypothetical protein
MRDLSREQHPARTSPVYQGYRPPARQACNKITVGSIP